MFQFDNPKTCVIVAGVNGAGKSTFTARFSSALPDIVIDPDRLADDCGSIVTGGRKALEEIERCIGSGISFCLETTLSGKHIVRTIRKVKAHGFKVDMVYFGLDSVGEHISRVAKRVSEGGHDIPEEVIRRRYASRFECLCRVLPLCDTAILGTFDDFADITALYFGRKLMDWNFNDRAWIKEFYPYYLEHGGEMYDSENDVQDNSESGDV